MRFEKKRMKRGKLCKDETQILVGESSFEELNSRQNALCIDK